jgi:hypothetical protein
MAYSRVSSADIIQVIELRRMGYPECMVHKKDVTFPENLYLRIIRVKTYWEVCACVRKVQWIQVSH